MGNLSTLPLRIESAIWHVFSNEENVFQDGGFYRVWGGLVSGGGRLSFCSVSLDE